MQMLSSTQLNISGGLSSVLSGSFCVALYFQIFCYDNSSHLGLSRLSSISSTQQASWALPACSPAALQPSGLSQGSELGMCKAHCASHLSKITVLLCVLYSTLQNIIYIICLYFGCFQQEGKPGPPNCLEMKDLTAFSPRYGLCVPTSSYI